MQNKRTIGSILAIFGIVFVVYNVLVFLVFKTHTTVFWLSYIFSVIAFLACLASNLHTFSNPDIDAVFFGIPLVSLALFYLIAQFCVGVVFMVFQVAGTTLALIVQLVMLAIFAIVAILALQARSAVSQIDQAVRTNVQSIRNLVVDVDMLSASVVDAALKQELSRLAEAIRYSDPMSNAVSVPYEANLATAIGELRRLCGAGDYAQAQALLPQVASLLNERNQRLLHSK